MPCSEYKYFPRLYILAISLPYPQIFDRLSVCVVQLKDFIMYVCMYKSIESEQSQFEYVELKY